MGFASLENQSSFISAKLSGLLLWDNICEVFEQSYAY